MFSELKNIDIGEIIVILVDDIGEMVYSLNCNEKYDFLMFVNHTINMLKGLNKECGFSEIKFEKYYAVVYSINEYRVFFIKENIFSYKDKQNIQHIKNKIKNIIED